ncbi:hypothetical protein VP01_1271g2 [Puccinia sorghi]|uniref:Uncharacterized protein n=1 Tax=Puccinia sorghi TaxID=27349 RepID=A0A0L6VQF7_9BASI|nr:hypothetical protein VP01_1271g2 [Puccinia sorghi]
MLWPALREIQQQNNWLVEELSKVVYQLKTALEPNTSLLPPAAKSHAIKPAPQDPNQQRGRNTLSDLTNHMPSRAPSNQLPKPLIQIFESMAGSWQWLTPH